MTSSLFDGCVTMKNSNIKIKTLEKYASKCDNISWGCDEMKLISKSDYLLNCPCFQKITFNWSNSKDVLLDCDKFSNCIFESISISLDVFQSCLLFKVIGVYEGKAYDIVDFRFYMENSQKVKVNWYVSDFLVHWKAWRLQVVSWWKFNIYDFLTELVSYDVEYPDRYLQALEEYYITRFDFRIDFFHKNEIKHLEYSDVYMSNARKTVDNLVIDRHSKKLYTWWTAWNRKDKYIYTRMYQKQVEALDKWHGELYIDYLNYNGKVWRLEFEFLSKFTTARKNISFSDEFISHELTKQVFEYIWFSNKHGYFSRPKNKIDIPFDQLSSYRKKRIVTQLKNHSVKLYKAWINPYTVVSEWLRECDQSLDRQVLDFLFESSQFEPYENIITKLDISKSTVDDYYDRFLKSQLWVDQ